MNPQNPHITQALEHLQKAHYAGYFEEMDKVTMPNHLQPIYATYKSQFMQGLKTVEFFQQLEVFAKEVDQQTTVALPDTTIRVVKVYTSPPKTWQSWLQKLQGRQDQTYWQCLAYASLGYNQDDITQTLTTYLPPLTKEAESKDEATLRKTYPLYEAEPDIETNFFNNKNKRILLLTGEVGTGKTTLMQKLFLQKAQQRVGKKIAFIYADQDTHAHIALAIAQGVQWLWIDAFDEDAQARQAQNETEYLYRLQSLMEQVQGVERVLLSMRTEFLPEDHIKNQIFNTHSTCFVDLGLFAKPQILEHLTTNAYMRKENFVKAMREQLHKNNIFLRPFLFSRAEEILAEKKEKGNKQTPYTYTYTYQAYQKVVEKWAGREQDKKQQEKDANWVGFAGKVIEFCERVALYFYEGRQAIHYKEIEQQRETLGLDLHDARNHALLVRDERGNYRFAHSIFLDYFIAQNLLKGHIREEDLDKQKRKVSYDLYEEMCLGELANLPTQMSITSLRDLQNTPFDMPSFKAFQNLYIRALMIRYQKVFFQKELLEWHDILQEIDIQKDEDTALLALPTYNPEHYIWKDYDMFWQDQTALPTQAQPYYTRHLLAESRFWEYIQTHRKWEYNGRKLPDDELFIEDISLDSLFPYLPILPACQYFLQDMRHISFKNCALQDLTTFAPLLKKTQKLKYLWLHNNQINNIDALQSLVHLQELSLRNNQITNIDALQFLVHLQELWLDNNQITNIDSLQFLVHLQTLGLANNQITNIDALQFLVNLQNLGLEKNNIQDITPLLGLKQLEQLYLYGNSITDETMTYLREALSNTHILFTHIEVKARYAERYAYLNEELRTYYAKLWGITA
ncbi:MAG: hypothetical protein EAZ95_18825 [Bacteroidetes bacterium]|nr:MAG: hypothetical protein EAZ95_18825 [Bacteroidota bacterium]